MVRNEAIKAELALMKALERRVEHDRQALDLLNALKARVYAMSLDAYNAELERQLAVMRMNDAMHGRPNRYCEPTRVNGPLLRVAAVGCCVVCEN